MPVVEYIVHERIFKRLGYSNIAENHMRYYALTRKYYNDPELKP